MIMAAIWGEIDGGKKTFMKRLLADLTEQTRHIQDLIRFRAASEKQTVWGIGIDKVPQGEKITQSGVSFSNPGKGQADCISILSVSEFSK